MRECSQVRITGGYVLNLVRLWFEVALIVILIFFHVNTEQRAKPCIKFFSLLYCVHYDAIFFYDHVSSFKFFPALSGGYSELYTHFCQMLQNVLVHLLVSNH